MNSTTQLLIPAAGEGLRLGSQGPKALVELEGVPLLVRTLRRFEGFGLLKNPIIVVSASHKAEFERVLDQHFDTKNFSVVEGGKERQDSVSNGLDALASTTEFVVIHDAARVFISEDVIREALEAVAAHGAATVAIPTTDTILQGDDSGFLQATPDRRLLWNCQTPQVFRTDVIKRAYAWAREKGIYATDDASLVRASGSEVKLVAGDGRNVKITRPEDLEFGRYLLRSEEDES